MGDKGGKKNKEKSQKQSSTKQKQKDKDKSEKNPKSKLSGASASTIRISPDLITGIADSDKGGKVRISLHVTPREGSHFLTLPASWRIEELSTHFLRPPH